MKMILQSPAIRAYHGAAVGEEVEVSDALGEKYLQRGQAIAVDGRTASKPAAKKRAAPRRQAKKKAAK